MNRLYLPYCTLILAAMTLWASSYVALDATGTVFGKVRILQLENYGGVRFEHIKNLELWRLFVSQLIHVQPLHLLFNVISLVILGLFVERHIGFFRMFITWFITGTAGILISTLFVKAPGNIGTGASQAVMGIAAVGIILYLKKVETSKWLMYALIFSILPAIGLDIYVEYYPKPGHVLPLLLGFILGYFYLNKHNKYADSISANNTLDGDAQNNARPSA